MQNGGTAIYTDTGAMWLGMEAIGGLRASRFS
jgi:hypothetical protein